VPDIANHAAKSPTYGVHRRCTNDSAEQRADPIDGPPVGEPPLAGLKLPATRRPSSRDPYDASSSPTRLGEPGHGRVDGELWSLPHWLELRDGQSDFSGTEPNTSHDVERGAIALGYGVEDAPEVSASSWNTKGGGSNRQERVSESAATRLQSKCIRSRDWGRASNASATAGV
jgi:hypothetical protein